MLTHLEIDGFKNLSGVRLDLGPFTCVAGPNGVGKSNLFDAIRFLSLLADHKIMDAARRVRGADDDPTDPRELFSQDVRPGADMRIRLAAEMLVPWEIRDELGGSAHASITFLRYELELAFEAPTEDANYGRITICHEQLGHINQGDAPKRLPWPHSAGRFRKQVVRGSRRGGEFISTVHEDGVHIIRTHQDGGSRGQPRRSNAASATASVIAATNSVDDPTIFAAKQEMLGWRHLALEPSAMRRPDKFWEAEELRTIAESGAHIPATLARLARTSGDAAAFYADVADLLSDLLPVEEVSVLPNRALQQYELHLREPGGRGMGARSLSEGTLRFLALATIAVDPLSARMVCMEEPENGIHPQRIPAMLDLLRRIAVDPAREPSPENPVRQVLINTHSPRVIQELERRGQACDLVIAEPATVRGSGGPIRTVRFRHRSGTWRDGPNNPGVGPGSRSGLPVHPVGGPAPAAGRGQWLRYERCS